MKLNKFLLQQTSAIHSLFLMGCLGNNDGFLTVWCESFQSLCINKNNIHAS